MNKPKYQSALHRSAALTPLFLLSACGLQHIGVPPASAVQIALPAAKPRLYAVKIGQPNTAGDQQTPLLDMVVGAIAAAEIVDKSEQKSSRAVRLTAMIGREGDDFYARYVLDVASLLRRDGRTVSLIDPAGRALVLASPIRPPANAGTIETEAATPPANAGTIETGAATPPGLIVASGSPRLPPAAWVVGLKHVEIGYDAPGIADYFKPTASAEVSLVRGPPGSKTRSIPLSVIVPTGRYHFYTFRDILRHPHAAAAGLNAATEQLAKQTATAIGTAKPKT